jgi:hypothetical protein
VKGTLKYPIYLIAIALCLAGVAFGNDGVAARGQIIDGVTSIAVPGLPGPIGVFGEDAFVIVAGRADKLDVPVAGASILGKGRLAALGHNGYFDAAAWADAETSRFFIQLIRWSGKAAAQPAVPRIGLRGCKTLEPLLVKAGFKTVILDVAAYAQRLDQIDVLLAPAGEIHTEDVLLLESFIRRGGGLICGVPGWGFLQTRPGKTLAHDLPANQLFAKAGLIWTDGTVDGEKKRFAIQPRLSPMLNGSVALAALRDEAAGQRKLSAEESRLATAGLTRIAQAMPASDQLLLPAIQAAASTATTSAVLTNQSDLLATNGLAKLGLTLDLTRQSKLPADQIKPSPLADAFPGAVPAGASRVKRTLRVDLSIPDWHSTGLYAAPGERITVRVPQEIKGLKLRIGSHSDKLWNLPQWRRAPEIDRVWPLTAGENQAANSFGGLIYIVVPSGAKGTIEISIDQAIESPLFILGQTSVEDWKTRLRDLPGPWAEVAGEKIIFTLPSQFIRKLDDPASLMQWWDQVSDGAADLYAIPRHRPRPERYVADVQISAGYMHSGYPIMTHLDAAPRMVDLPSLQSKGEWGLFHELGHNHQKPDWTFPGTGEVTNNLLPLYLLETLCHHAPLHGSFTPQVRAKKEAAYLAKGADFATWQADPFLALIMYQQLRDEFGWEAFEKVFAEYRDLPLEARPKTELEKHDQWMVRFSRAAGRNLGPFFTHWGIPTTDAARKSIEPLPAWMPKAS